MVKRRPRHTHEEFARRGQDIYDRDVRKMLQPGDDGKFVAIDIESGFFEIDPDDVTAVNRLYARKPDAQPWLMRVGRLAAYQMGGRSLSGTRDD